MSGQFQSFIIYMYVCVCMHMYIQPNFNNITDLPWIFFFSLISIV